MTHKLIWLWPVISTLIAIAIGLVALAISLGSFQDKEKAELLLIAAGLVCAISVILALIGIWPFVKRIWAEIKKTWNKAKRIRIIVAPIEADVPAGLAANAKITAESEVAPGPATEELQRSYRVFFHRMLTPIHGENLHLDYGQDNERLIEMLLNKNGWNAKNGKNFEALKNHGLRIMNDLMERKIFRYTTTIDVEMAHTKDGEDEIIRKIPRKPTKTDGS